jgi:hypothetical protein
VLLPTKLAPAVESVAQPVVVADVAGAAVVFLIVVVAEQHDVLKCHEIKCVSKISLG